MTVSQRREALVSKRRVGNITPRWVSCPTSQATRLTAVGLLNVVRALGGYTIATSSENLFDTEEFVESEYTGNLASQGRMPPITLNW